MSCAVRGCKARDWDAFGTRLCDAHGTKANQARDGQGLTFAPWPDVVRAVATWVEQENKPQPRREA